MKILIVDDLRTPDGIGYQAFPFAAHCDWDLALNYQEAIKMLTDKEYDYITLDHDLGEEKTGYDVACWLERELVEGRRIPNHIKCHSANPVGKKRILQVVESIERFR